MDLSEPATALSPGLTVPVLRALASRSTGASAEQVRRAAGVGTPAGVRRALDRLADHGLLDLASVGNRFTVYTLNHDHVLYPAVQALLTASDALPSRLADVISRWQPVPVCTALFGSAARRDGGLHSDVDLLVIRPSGMSRDQEPAWDEQLHELRGQVRRSTGNYLQILERTTEQLAALAGANEAIVAEWRRDAVTVYGRDLRELIEELG